MKDQKHGSRGTESPEPLISPEAIVVAADCQVSSLVGDETVILHLDDGMYYGLDPVGTSIWDLLQQPRRVREIRDRILDEYEVHPDRCERELIALLQELAERRLVEVVGSTVGPP